MLRYKEYRGEALYLRSGWTPEFLRYYLPVTKDGQVTDVATAYRLECYVLETSSWFLPGKRPVPDDHALTFPVTPEEWDRYALAQYHGKFASAILSIGYASGFLKRVGGRWTRYPKHDFQVYHGSASLRLIPL